MSLEDEHNKLKADHEILQKRHTDVMEGGGSYNRLQSDLDDAHLKNKDDAAAHEQAMAAQQKTHEAAIETLKNEHAENVKATVAALKEKVLGPALRAEHTRQAAELAAKQEAELKAL